MTFSYCGETAPGETNLTCRDIGAAANFKEKVQNSEIWKIQQRAYKKYYARRKKGKMSSTEFERWSRESLKLRDEALIEYRSLHTKEEREEFIEAFREMQNRE